MDAAMRNFIAREQFFSLDASHPNRVDNETKVQHLEEKKYE